MPNLENIDIKIASIQKFSLLDYPGKLSCVIFCQGCPNRCVYCHNPDFIDCKAAGSINFHELQTFLESRRNLLEAVVFSGGEALVQTDLKIAMQYVKSLNLYVGLHTSGIPSSRFLSVLDIVDWVGFDIKTWFDKYELITKVPGSGTAARISLNYLLESGVEYEIRTTYDSRHINTTDLENIARYLKENGCKKWILQECVLRYNGVKTKLLLPDKEAISQLSSYVKVELRRE